jgi:aminomethyltransferase
LVGIRIEGRAPARAGTLIRSQAGETIGHVTSGTFGPSVNAPVALGYVRADFADDNTRLDLIVREKAIPGIVSPLPFIPHHYAR